MNSNKVEEGLFNEEVSFFLRKKNVGLFGCADLSLIPHEERYKFPRSISFGYPIEKNILNGIRYGPTHEYLVEYNRLNELLVKTAKDLEMFISSFGFKALALEGSVRKQDDKNLSSIHPHKTSATLSGLGWIGKCNLLVTNNFGSGIRLSTVLTDIPLLAGTPITESKCGECTICYQVCPAKAITGKNWIQRMTREEIYDAFACKAKAQELSNQIGAKHSICGICIANCPLTLKYVNGK